MKLNRGSYCAFAAVLACCCQVDSIRACSCEELDPLTKWEMAETVFVGEVCAEQLVQRQVALFFTIEGRMVMFRILQSWKEDDQAGERVVFMARDSGLCGPDQVQFGDRFLVYASPDAGRDGELYTDGCQRTEHLCGRAVGDESIPLSDLFELEAAGIAALRPD